MLWMYGCLYNDSHLNKLLDELLNEWSTMISYCSSSLFAFTCLHINWWGKVRMCKVKRIMCVPGHVLVGDFVCLLNGSLLNQIGRGQLSIWSAYGTPVTLETTEADWGMGTVIYTCGNLVNVGVVHGLYLLWDAQCCDVNSSRITMGLKCRDYSVTEIIICWYYNSAWL